MNSSGIYPTKHNVLLKPKSAEEITAGGVIIPEMTKEKEKYATTEGMIIAVSPFAFSYADPEEWEAVGAEKPGPGQRVIYAKYAGSRVKGLDGEEYLMINDEDVCATVKDTKEDT